MSVPFIDPSFTAGELAPSLWGRLDLDKFHAGAATMRNCFVGYRGGAYSRAGTRYVGTSQQNPNAGPPPRLIPFQFSESQGYALEFGNFYIRFLFQGGYVVDPATGAPYQIASPYAASDLPLLKFAQSADTMSLAHPNYPTYDLKRFGNAAWTLAPTAFGSTIPAPASCTGTATTQPSQATSPPTLPCAYAYVVTAINTITGEESQASPIANILNSVDIAATAGSLVITWTPVAGAGSYNIYKAPPSYNTQPGNVAVALPVPAGALFGFCGTAFGTQFVDSNITAVPSLSPPQHRNPLAPGQVTAIQLITASTNWTDCAAAISSATGSGFSGQVVIVNGQPVSVIILNPGQNYRSTDVLSFSGDGTICTGTATIGPQTGTWPSVVSYFQQRRVYAASLNQPDTYWMSQPGAFVNFDTSIPVSDADAISGTPWSEQVNGILWMLEMPLGLLTFTGSGVWQVGAPGSFASSPQPITPANQVAAPQSSIGANAQVSPVKINWDVIYLQSKGATVRDLSYQLFFNIYTGSDISWQSSHLLLSHEIVQWCWCEEPYRVLWAVRDDGILLSLTYVKEQQVAGWARHDTQGVVHSVCSVTEPPVDALYLVVERPAPGGGTQYLIERMDNRLWAGIEDVWAVDAGVSLPMIQPNARLYASAASGAGVVFTASAAVFTAANVGNVIRMGGGIATVTLYTDSEHVTGTWVYPCQQIVPNDPNSTPLWQTAGNWTIAAPTNAVSGLSYLAGRQVVGLADGVPVGPFTVSGGGAINLPFAASAIVIGLGFTAQVQSVYLDAGQPTIQGRRKVVTAVTARLEASAPMQAGANQLDASAVTPAPLFATWSGLPSPPPQGAALPATYQSPGGATVQPLFTGDVRVPLPNPGPGRSSWQKPGQVAVQQTLPLPLQLLALLPEALAGDTPENDMQPRQQQSRGGATVQPMRRAA